MGQTLREIKEEVDATDYRKLFAWKMQEELKWSDFRQAVQDRMADQGKQWGQVVVSVMREWGYRDTATLRAQCYEMRVKGLEEARIADMKQVQREVIDERTITNFERLYNELPDTAEPEDEVNWIKAHPAMNRKDRQKGDSKVIITANDIESTVVGRAPSKAAVNQLQHWSNRPSKFYEMILSHAKKELSSADDEVGETKEEAATTEEIRLFLESL